MITRGLHQDDKVAPPGTRVLWGAAVWLVFSLVCESPWPAAASSAPWQISEVRSFGFPELAGVHPAGRLLLASDGAFYGMTRSDNSVAGTIYRLQPGDLSYRVLLALNSSGRQMPYGGLKEGPQGRLYGALQSREAGLAQPLYPALFSCRKDGGDFRILIRLTNAPASTFGSGAAAVGGEFVVATNGGVFGVIFPEPRTNGAVFRVGPDGHYSELHALPGLPSGFIFQPAGQGLVTDAAGTLFGVSPAGGNADRGFVFRLEQDGTGWRVLHEFGAAGDGEYPQCALLRASDGNFYGLTQTGGAHGNGQLFRISAAGNYEALYSFLREPFNPLQKDLPLMEGSDGRLYGSSFEDTFGVLSQIYRIDKDGSAFAIIYSSVVGNPGISTLVEAPDGLLYGTSPNGTEETDWGNGTGTIFRIAPDGSQFAMLRKFSASGGDGQAPFARLLASQDGALYGTTVDGGRFGFGTVFQVNRDGSAPQILRDFCRDDPNATSPNSGLIEDTAGWLYGTAESAEGGSVYRLRRVTREFQVLHRFSKTNSAGHNPTTLAWGMNNDLYGSTMSGGLLAPGEPDGLGTLFSLNSDGTGYRLLHNFGGVANDGRKPQAPLLAGSDGRLYGVTWLGGSVNGGVVFRLNPDGTAYQILKNFTTNTSQPFRPNGPLFEGTAGTSLGVTMHGGAGFGTVYQLNRDGTGFKVLHAFSGVEGEGRYPQDGLTRGADERLYGLARVGVRLDSWLLYRLELDGTGYEVVSTGSFPRGERAELGLTLARDAALYGMTRQGGEWGFGSIFRLMPPNFAPRFMPESLRRQEAGGLMVHVIGAVGQEAQLEASDGSGFEPVRSIRFTPQPLTVDLPVEDSTSRFYRIQVR